MSAARSFAAHSAGITRSGCHAQNSFTWDGSFPLNTSGGQLSAGQAGCAGGYIELVETIRQLTGEAGERQVPDAKVGLVSGFGMINFDRGLASGAALLGRAD